MGTGGRSKTAETDEIAYLRRRAVEERKRAARTAGSAATAHAAMANAYERRVATAGE